MAQPLDDGSQPISTSSRDPSFHANSSYPPPQYSSYAPVTADFPMDSDLTMTETYSPGSQSALRAQLEDATATTNSTRNGNTHPVIMSASNGPQVAGMAPPQTPQQSAFPPTTARTSVDDNSDPAVTGEGSKRKRSKVSRACDECRRKKVKCDAAADDGTIKTCTNCAKSGLICEYSRIPMKRGPSKGYIKELSERVQQVESLQLALSAQPGFRQSLDAASNAGTFSDTMFSPDDPMSAKRNFSFSDARNPFPQSEFQRDRIPSVGNWGAHSPTASIFRPRDRGSLAIAPDQTGPVFTFPEISEPFWSEFEEPPVPKRRKLDDETVEPFNTDQDHLSRYYQTAHSNLALLPDADTVLSVVNNTPPLLQHAFGVVVGLFPTPKSSASINGQNGAANPSMSRLATKISKHFSTYESLAYFLVASARENPADRTADENLVYLWIYALMSAQSENDLQNISYGPLPRSHLIRIAIDLASHLLNSFADTTHSTIAPKKFRYWVQRARDSVCVLAKFHALAIGSINFVSLQSYAVHTDSAVTMPATAAFLARASNILTIILSMLQTSFDSPNTFDIMSKDIVIRQHLLECVNQTQGLDPQSLVVRQIQSLFDLLLSRFSALKHPITILQPAVELADLLSTATSTSSTEMLTYDPTTMHMFSLATITILEFLVDVADPDMSKLAEAALDKIVPVLEQKAEEYHQDTSVPKDFYRTRYGSDMSETSTTLPKTFWADCLLGIVEEQRKAGWARERRGSAPGPSAITLPDFTMLCRRGYLNVLVRWSSRGRRST